MHLKIIWVKDILFEIETEIEIETETKSCGYFNVHFLPFEFGASTALSKTILEFFDLYICRIKIFILRL